MLLLPSSGKAPTVGSIGMAAALQNFPICLAACVTNGKLCKVLTHRGADKSLARPGRKEANVSVRIAWISFGALPCRKKIMTARVSMLKSRASVTCFRACFLPGRVKDLSAPGKISYHKILLSY